MKIIQRLLLFIYLLILAGCNANSIFSKTNLSPEKCPSSPPSDLILKPENIEIVDSIFKIKNGTIDNNQTIGYQFQATKGQKLSLEINKPSEVCIWMMTPDNKFSKENASFKEQTLSQTGFYLIQLATSNLKNNEIKYDIGIKLSDPIVAAVTPTPSLSSTPTPTPTSHFVPTPKSTSTPSPTPSPRPTFTHRPTPTPQPTSTHRPTPTPKPASTHRSVSTPKPTPRHHPKSKGLSQAQAYQLVKAWYNEKPKIFGKNYQVQNVKKYTTGQLYNETLVKCDKNDCGGGVGWLKKYGCYYTYDFSKIKKIIDFSSGDNSAKLIVNIKEKYQLHGPQSARCGKKPKTYQKNISYWFSKDRGIWKISKYKVPN